MNDKNTSNSKRKKRRLTLIVVLLLLAALVWFLPKIIAKTSLRDRVLNSMIDDPHWVVSSKSATFGWFSGVVVEDLEIKSTDQTTQLQIPRLSAEKSWLALWLAEDDMGAFEIEHAVLNVVVAEEETTANGEPASADQPVELLPILTAVIKQAHVVVSKENEKEPVIDLDGIDLTVHLERDDAGSHLKLEPIKIFDDQELDRETCNQGLQLVWPVVAEELNIRGKMSADITNLRVPLSVSRDEFAKYLVIEGNVQIHEVNAQIKDSITQRLAKVFAKMVGIKDVPDEWRLAKDAEIRFRVRDGRVVHESVTMLLPDVSADFGFHSAGSVSLDEDVELLVSAKLPATFLGDGPLAKKLSQTPIELRVFGKIGDSTIGLPADPKWVFEINDLLLAEDLSEDDKTLRDRIIGLIARLHKNSGIEAPELPATLAERIRKLNLWP
jgi:hypothetical protein